MSDVIDAGNNGAPQAAAPEPPSAPAVAPKNPSREAAIQAGEARMKAILEAERNKAAAPTAPTTPPPALPTTPTVEPPKAAPAPNKEEVPEQFRKPDGTWDLEKLEKSKQHLEEKAEKARKVYEDYRKLQSELTPINQELAKAGKNQPAPAANPDEPKPVVSPVTRAASVEELKKELAADLEKDPAEALVKAVLLGKELAAADRKAEEARKSEAEKQENWIARLDEHAKTKPWVQSPEGFAAIKEVLLKRPYLYKGEDPYGDALAFVDASKFQSGPAASGTSVAPAAAPRTPILSASHGAPPVAPQAVSNEAKLQDLKARYRDAVKANPFSKETVALEKELDRLAREVAFKKK